MNYSASNTSEESLRWWRGWGFRALVWLCALVLFVRLAVGYWAGRELAKEIATIRARGEPITLKDQTIALSPEVVKAWSLQQQAYNAHVPTIDSPSNSSLYYREWIPYPPLWMQMAEASEAAHGAVFVLARKARAVGRTIPPPESFFSTAQPAPIGYNQARHVAAIVNDGAMLKHLQGDDVEALRRLRDSLYIGFTIRHNGSIISQLSGSANDALTAVQAQVMAPGLRLSMDSPDAAGVREEVKLLIHDFLDERLTSTGFRASVRHERAYLLDAMAIAAKESWWIQPLADRELTRRLRNLSIEIEAAELTDELKALKMLKLCRWDAVSEQPRGAVSAPRYSRWFSDGTADLTNYFDRYFRTLAECRLTAVSLAAQLYRADHDRWPATLDDLVPDYLPAMPIDPCSTNGGRFGYVMEKHRATGADRPLVYFGTGESNDLVLSDNPMYGWQIEDARGRTKPPRMIRQYRDLSRFEPSAK